MHENQKLIIMVVCDVVQIDSEMSKNIMFAYQEIQCLPSKAYHACLPRCKDTMSQAVSSALTAQSGMCPSLQI